MNVCADVLLLVPTFTVIVSAVIADIVNGVFDAGSVDLGYVTCALFPSDAQVNVILLSAIIIDVPTDRS